MNNIEGKNMDEYKILIEKSEKLHGELCPGVIIGTKMSITAMKKLGMNPLEKNDHLMVTWKQTDACPTLWKPSQGVQ